RFKVLRKLGYGGSGTVWLCKDNQKGNYVALKVLPASITGVFEKSAVNEISLQQQLWSQGTTVQDEGENHIVRFLGEFRHVSPNGTHLCLLLEAMGPNLADMAIRRPWESGSLPEGGSITGQGRFPIESAKEIGRNVLLALDFLHQNGIMHGDL